MFVGASSETDDSRTATVGLATLSAMCGTEKYSVNEEYGGFNAIKVNCIHFTLNR